MNRRYCLSALTILLLAVCSCSREQLVENGPQEKGQDDASLIHVTLNLGVASLQSGTAGVPADGKTRAVDDPADYLQTQIKNLWVLQFNGTGPDALLARASYISDFTSTPTAGLMESVSANKIVLIANTCNQDLGNAANSACIFSPGVTTIAALEQTRKSLISSDTDTSCSPEALFGTVNGTQFQPLYGSFVQTVTPSLTEVSCTLERTIARLDFHVKLSNTAGLLKLTSAQLVNVPSKTIYYSEHIPTASADPNGVFIPGQPYISYTAIDLSTSMTASGDADFTYYVPATIWGTKSASTTPEKKPDYIPNATRLILKGIASDGSERPVTYTFVLGSNMTDDFSLRSGYQYCYNINITQIGDADTDDHRVMKQRDFDGVVDFRTDNRSDLSNCYILHPPFVAGATRDFKIPLDRIQQFWGEESKKDNPDYEYDENMNFTGQSKSVKWRAEVLWSDFPIDGTNFSLPDYEGTGLTTGASGSFFTARVAAGTSGNVVVKVSTVRENSDHSESKVVCWSWHLWITDYDPDYCIANNYTPAEGQYIYTVPSGEVHRYAGSYWSSGGLYENKFIMDRNVGCLTSDYTGSGQGALYYQFGRKDPFPGKTYYMNGVVKKTESSAATRQIDVIAAEDVSRDLNNNPTYNNVPYSVKNPLMFIRGTYWTYKDKYNPTTYNASIRWNDPHVTTTTGKSLFDPCPPGWRLPEITNSNGVFSDMVYNSSDHPTTNIKPSVAYTPVGGFPPYNSTGKGGNGCIYWPYSAESPVVEGGIYVPAPGIRYYDNTESGSVAGAIYNVDSNGNYWSSCPRSATYASYLSTNAAGLNPSNNTNRAYGFAVRCLQE